MRKIHIFGQAFKDERIRAGKTLKETATALGVSESSLSRLENGENAPPREEMIIRAAQFFGIKPDELIYAAVRQREGLYNVVAPRTLEVYGHLLVELHHLDPKQVEEIDAILHRKPKGPARTTKTSTPRRGTPLNGSSCRTEITSNEKEEQGTRRMRNHRPSAAAAPPQRAARIKHSPRSDLKEDTHEKETVVH